MSRVPPTPVDIWVDGEWIRGTLRTCEANPDDESCSAVVSYGGPTASTTARVDGAQIRTMSGDPGCPALHKDAIRR
jgi:hypothetical protein